jgi:hypothetical protein
MKKSSFQKGCSLAILSEAKSQTNAKNHGIMVNIAIDKEPESKTP